MFIARQPIFKRNLEVYGYELLFRSSSHSNNFDGMSSQSATASVIGGLFEMGIDQIVEDKLAFVNFDEHFIQSNALELIPPDRLVVEMLENVKVDDLLLKRLEEIKQKGYKIALDDFVEKYNNYPLVPYADIIKFDLIETPLQSIKNDVRTAQTERKVLLAEKIETKEEFELAKEMGFHLFQGYFFSKPSIASKSGQKTTSKGQYLRLLNELKKEEPSYQTLAEIIEKDVNLVYRLMRVSSSRSGEELLYSVKKALTFMGLNEVERWVNVLMLQDMGKDKPTELTKISLIRSRLAESIVMHAGLTTLRYEASLMGLFSTLDAMLDQPMGEALSDIALPDSITEALLYQRGVLYPIYQLITTYEQGDWTTAGIIAKEIHLDEDTLFEKYLLSIKWASDIFDRMY